MKKWISVILAVCLLAALTGCCKRNAVPSESGNTAPTTQPVATAPTRQPGEAQVEFSDFDEETESPEESEPTTPKPTKPVSTTPTGTTPAPTTPTETTPTTTPTQPTVPTQPQDTTPTQTQPVFGEDGYYNQVVKP